MAAATVEPEYVQEAVQMLDGNVATLEYEQGNDDYGQSDEDEMDRTYSTIRQTARMLNSTQNKIVVAPDLRGVPELRLRFPNIPVATLTALMEQYKRYSAVVDVLLALKGTPERFRPISASFWDRQNWPRPGQLPSLLSWSVVDSTDSYDVIAGPQEDPNEDDDWIDTNDDDDFVEMDIPKQHCVESSNGTTQHVNGTFQPSNGSGKLRYSQILLQGSQQEASQPLPRIPPLVHRLPMKMSSIPEDGEFDSDADDEDDGMESVIFRERYVMKSVTQHARKMDKLRMKPATLQKIAQRISTKAAANHPI